LFDVYGNIKKDLKLENRVYKCDKCGLTIDRDLNASINICRVGATTLGIDDVRLAIAKQSSF